MLRVLWYVTKVQLVSITHLRCKTQKQKSQCQSYTKNIGLKYQGVGDYIPETPSQRYYITECQAESHIENIHCTIQYIEGPPTLWRGNVIFPWLLFPSALKLDKEWDALTSWTYDFVSKRNAFYGAICGHRLLDLFILTSHLRWNYDKCKADIRDPFKNYLADFFR